MMFSDLVLPVALAGLGFVLFVVAWFLIRKVRRRSIIAALEITITDGVARSGNLEIFLTNATPELESHLSKMMGYLPIDVIYSRPLLRDAFHLIRKRLQNDV